MNRTYHEMAEQLGALGNELLDDLDMAWAFPAETRRDSKLRSAAALILRAAELVLELDTTPELAAEVRALSDLCACLHERGDHMVASPHRCEGDGVRRVTAAAGDRDGLLCCGCPGFRPVRVDTLPDLMTEPPPAPAPEPRGAA